MCKNIVENKEINVESDKDDFVEVESVSYTHLDVYKRQE